MMNDQDKQTPALLARIAEALEQLVPKSTAPADWMGAPAYVWNDGIAHSISQIEAPALDLLGGIDRQKVIVVENIRRLASGNPAHDMLLWGSRGMGKSALIRSAVADVQSHNKQGGNEDGGAIALVQVGADAVASLPDLFGQLSKIKRNFLVFVDDLGFGEGDSVGPRHLRSWLEGGVEARPANVRLAVTSNRRAILARQASEQDNPLNPRDVVDDQLALADRFGLSLGFHACSQDDYLAIVRGYAARYALELDEAEALLWSKQRGARSGRVAWHFITELAGRAGKELS